MLVVTLAEVAFLPQPAAAVDPPEVEVEVLSLERPDAGAALVTARLTGQPVKIADMTSETAEFVALPDGQIEATIHSGIMRIRRGDEWVPVDLTLRRRTDGSVAPVAHPFDLILSGSRPAGTHELAGIGYGDDRLSLGWNGALPEPVLTANRATYPEVLPGVDLVLEAGRENVETFLIVKSREAASRIAEVTFPVTGHNARSHERDSAGNVAIQDGAGRTIATIPAPEMWDARRDAAGDPTNRVIVETTMEERAALAGAPGGLELTLSPDQDWLTDPALHYPITIDPQINPLYTTFDTYVKETLTSDRSGANDLQLGITTEATPKRARAFVHWGVSALVGKQITSATVYYWNWYSTTCSSKSWEIWSTGPASTSTRWGSQPPWHHKEASSTATKGLDSTCDDGWVSISGTNFFQRAANAGQTTAYMGVRATNESDGLAWKQFRSRNASDSSQVPYAVVNYNSKPQVVARQTVPSTVCTTGSGRPFINTKTPQLKAQITDAEGSQVTAKFEWWVTNGSLIGSLTQGPAASGSWQAVTVPAGAFGEGGTYSWRVQGYDGSVWGPWSSWCEFRVDTIAPSVGPEVSSADYPEGEWAGGAGTPGDFTFTSGGVADVVSYRYGLNQNPPTSTVSAASLGGSATVSITPLTNLPQTLYVRSVDRAGNLSPIRSYQFNVGSGAGTVLSPKTGDISGARFALEAQGQSTATGVTYQWRRGDADAWTTIPSGDVALAAGGGEVIWPQPTTGGGAFAKLNWDVAATLNDAEDGLEPLDGPLQVQALFEGAGGASDEVKVTFDLNRAWAGSVDVGPGTVNLLTGDFNLHEIDADTFGMALSRTYSTRQAGDVDVMFGPGWVSSVAATANPGFTDLTVTGSLVQVGLPDGATLGFALASGDATSAVYAPQIGAEGYKLTWTASPDRYSLVDPSGNMVQFTRPSGGATGLYVPTAVVPVVSSETVTLSWEMVPGSTTQARPTRVLAPVPSGVSCTPSLVAGCKALTFTYAATTTATGTGPGEWGDYLDRLVRVEFIAWDPDAAPAAMRTVEVARYAYDSAGRLRASWDARLDWIDTAANPPATRHVRTTYDYDSSGILSAQTPPGQLPWQFGYTTVPGDSGAGRLETVTRSALAAGTAVTTVVYRVPVSGNGAPYDLSASQTARWGQAEAPADASAVFPPTQVPTMDQSAGVLPTSYEYANLSYLDTNGRLVNSIAPGGGIDATWYDVYGNITQTLTPGNRDRALHNSASDTPAEEAALAADLSTMNIFSADGQRLLSEFGPERDVALPDGSVVRGRAHAAYTYDEGAPTGQDPYNLVTTAVTSVRYTGPGGTPADADQHTTAIEYDWDLQAPVVETVDPAGLALTSRTGYDAKGRVAVITTPAGGTATDTPSSRITIYYSAAANATYTVCGDRPEWDGLVCRTHPGGQPATGPELPHTVVTYDMYGRVRGSIESTSTGELRRTTVALDAAGRPQTVATTAGSVLGTAVPKVRTVYDRDTGQAVRTQSLDGGDNVTAEIVRVYDSLGRLTSYTDADANTSATTYDIASRVESTFDGKATRTYTYDGGSERRGLPTQVIDSGAGTFSAVYDTDGNPISQTWSQGTEVTYTINEEGTLVGLTYTQVGCGQPDCTLFTETVTLSGAGQWHGRRSTLSWQTYTYDKAARLTTVYDTVAGQCVTRVYEFAGTAGQASNRTSLTSYGPGGDGACQTTTGPDTRYYTYDSADRITTAGTVYDELGRTLTVPAMDTILPGNGDAVMTYHTNDMVRTISQNGRTTTRTLDVLTNRFRSWTDDATGSLVTRIHHYAGDHDAPVWTDEGDGTWTRPVAGLVGTAAVQTGPTTGNVYWRITNLHGDYVAGMDPGTPGLTHTSEQVEFGQLREVADTGIDRYGWLGDKQRAADTPTGVILMGVRLYSPTTGRFLQVDPVYGGSANSYDYCSAEPLTCYDLEGLYGYSFRYWIGWGPWVSSSHVMSQVRKRFWLYFPIPSNCASISAGRRCSLAGNPVLVQYVWSTGFQLKSLPGHSEGAGKYIKFWFTKSWGSHYLNVKAWGPDVTWCDKQSWCAAANRRFAYGLWGVMAWRLRLYM
jgi:RHS repeat-associated protein